MEEGRKNIFVRGWEGIRSAYSVLADHKFTTIAGTLVFFLILSLVPFLFWLTLLFGRTGLDTAEILELELFDWAKDLFVYLQSNTADAAAGASIFLLATTLWSSTGFFYHLRRSGEILYRYNRRKKGWKVRLSAAFLTLGILLYFAASGAVLIGAIFCTRLLPAWISYLAVYSLVLVIAFFSAWILNAYVCPYRASPNDTVPGSALTAVAWFFASVLFAVYVRIGNQERLYGALSLVVVFLLWLYWMMICFTVGVIFNRHRMEVRHLEHKKL